MCVCMYRYVCSCVGAYVCVCVRENTDICGCVGKVGVVFSPLC